MCQDTFDALQYWCPLEQTVNVMHVRPLHLRVKQEGLVINGLKMSLHSLEVVPPGTAVAADRSQSSKISLNLSSIPVRQFQLVDHVRSRLWRILDTSKTNGSYRVKCKLPSFCDQSFAAVFGPMPCVVDTSVESLLAGYTPVKGYSNPASSSTEALAGRRPYLEVRRATYGSGILEKLCSFENFPKEKGGQGAAMRKSSGAVVACSELFAVMSIQLKRSVGAKIRCAMYVSTLRFDPTHATVQFPMAHEILVAYSLNQFIEPIRVALKAHFTCPVPEIVAPTQDSLSLYSSTSVVEVEQEFDVIPNTSLIGFVFSHWSPSSATTNSLNGNEVI